MLSKKEKKQIIQKALKAQFGFSPSLKDIEILSAVHAFLFFRSSFKVNGHMYELKIKIIGGGETLFIEKLECVGTDETVATCKPISEDKEYIRIL